MNSDGAMDFALEPVTERGRHFVSLAEQHAVEAARDAAGRDATSTFPTDVFESMRTSGFIASFVPVEFDGLGLDSLHDLAVGLSRLGAADGSTALAANMHFILCFIAARNLRAAREADDNAATERLSAFMALLGGGLIGMANTTEPGTDTRHPLLEATPVDGGYELSGRKTFGTLSPVADFFLVSARLQHDDSVRTASAAVLRGSPGQTVLDNWSALGMRGSGSHDVVYDACFVPADRVLVGAEWGVESEQSMLIATAGNLGLLATFLGIAEGAASLAIESVRAQVKAPDNRPLRERAGIQHVAAEIQIDLAVCRALLARLGLLLDAQLIDRPVASVSLEVLRRLNVEAQCAKLVINRKTIEIVDRAMSVCGGRAYLTDHPLSRLCRDVRAGPFMQPLSSVEAHEYIGKAILGLPTE